MVTKSRRGFCKPPPKPNNSHSVFACRLLMNRGRNVPPKKNCVWEIENNWLLIEFKGMLTRITATLATLFRFASKSGWMKTLSAARIAVKFGDL
jgi:hypothetical protein